MSEPEKAVKPRIQLSDGKEITVKKARAVMEELALEAADLREDESTGAKSRRVVIRQTLRAIQKQLDNLEEVVEVVVPTDATKQWPFRIGPTEFWPGTHKVRASVAQTLRYMMDQHRRVESDRIINNGNAVGESYGKELPAL